MSVEKFKVSMELDLIDPRSNKEMAKDNIAWIKGEKELASAFSSKLTIKEELKLDSRKWDVKTIEDGMYAVARYDLKVLDSNISKLKKKSGGMNAKEIGQKAKKYYDRACSDITKKVSVALEELSKEGGDDKKALADGKTALKKLSDVDLELAFTDIAHSCAAALRGIHKAEKKIKPEDGKKKAPKFIPVEEKDMVKAFLDCAKSLDGAARKLKGTADDADTAIKFLLRIGKKISRDNKASDDMKNFGKEVSDAQPTFDKYSKAVDKFQVAVDEAVEKVKKANLKPLEANDLANDLDKQPEGISAAKAVDALVRALSKRFKTLEKQLS